MIHVDINEQNFENEVLNYDKLVVVKFYGTWCGPCRMQSAIFDQMKDAKYKDVKIAEVDVDQNDKLCKQNGIMSVPTMIFYKDGAEIDKVVGFRNLTQSKALFDQYM